MSEEEKISERLKALNEQHYAMANKLAQLLNRIWAIKDGLENGTIDGKQAAKELQALLDNFYTDEPDPNVNAK